MNDEIQTPNEDWGMSVSNISSPEAAIENDGGGWTMPEPIFRVSDGDKVEKPKKKLPEEETELPEHFAPQTDSFVLAQPDISEDFKFPEIAEQTYQPTQESPKNEKGNAKWVVLLGGIFIFFAVFVGIIFVIYYWFSNK